MEANRSAVPLATSSYHSLAEHVVHHAAKLSLQPVDIEQTSAAIRAQAFSWDETVALARRHWVLPLLAGNLLGIRELYRLVPPEVERLLQVAQFGASARTTTVLGTFQPVAEDLLAQDVDFAFMKGAALCRTVYPAGWRLLNDIDVLVRKADYLVVERTLVRHGFAPALEQAEPGRQLKTHQVSFVRPWTAQGPLVVDLHWHMCDYPGLDVDTEELLGGAREPVAAVGTSGRVLSAEDLLVHYATQFVVDFLRCNALRLADIHALVGSGLDWPQLATSAIRAGAAGPTFVALQLAADRGAAVPVVVLVELGRACPGSRETAEVLRDPRWPFGRWHLSKSAKHVLLYKLHARSRRHSGGSQDRPVRGLLTTRLRAALAQGRWTALRRLVGGAAWALRLWAARRASDCGAVALGAWLRGTLWCSKRPRPDHLSVRDAVASVRQ